jgi:hypothetical protein
MSMFSFCPGRVARCRGSRREIRLPVVASCKAYRRALIISLPGRSENLSAITESRVWVYQLLAYVQESLGILPATTELSPMALGIPTRARLQS